MDATGHHTTLTVSLSQQFEQQMWIHKAMSALSLSQVANQGVTKRYRLSWLTNSALLYEPNCGGGGGGAGSQPMSTNCAHGAQINFEDLTPYWTYGANKKMSFNDSWMYIVLYGISCLRSVCFVLHKIYVSSWVDNYSICHLSWKIIYKPLFCSLCHKIFEWSTEGRPKCTGTECSDSLQTVKMFMHWGGGGGGDVWKLLVSV